MSDYHFPADLQPYVDEMLKSGRYEHVSELILEAVYLHRDREWLRQKKLDELRKEIQIGIDQADRGQVAELDLDDIWKRARAEAAKVKRSKPKKARSRK
jgi:antitoxin ParD1/3/4